MLQVNHRYPYNPHLKERVRELRRNMTAPEKKLWYYFLRKLPLSPPQLRGKASEESRGSYLRVYRQRPIGNFIVDFYIPSIKLVVEIDGDSHYQEGAQKYDYERTEYLEGLGIRVIRFSNDEVMKNFEGVCEKILEFLKNNNG